MKPIIVTSIICLSLIALSNCNSATDPYIGDLDSAQVSHAVPSVQMYYYIKKYSDIYEIPTEYAFSLAYHESRYQGPYHFDYNHKLSSKSGALGPMQILPSTARAVYQKPISSQQLKSDIRLNILISMMLLRRLHNKYNDWMLAFGAYNTGRPIRNQYARNIIQRKYIWKAE